MFRKASIILALIFFLSVLTFAVGKKKNINMEGIWLVESMTQDGKIIPITGETLWYRFNHDGEGTVVRDDDKGKRAERKFIWTEKGGEISVRDNETPAHNEKTVILIADDIARITYRDGKKRELRIYASRWEGEMPPPVAFSTAHRGKGDASLSKQLVGAWRVDYTKTKSVRSKEFNLTVWYSFNSDGRFRMIENSRGVVSTLSLMKWKIRNGILVLSGKGLSRDDRSMLWLNRNDRRLTILSETSDAPIYLERGTKDVPSENSESGCDCDKE
jgi:hypothetical protein